MNRFTVTFITLLIASPAVVHAEPARQAAREILDQSGVQGGLIVHLGCGDGMLTAALGEVQRNVVQGLDVDPRQVENARAIIRSLGWYGRVSVAQWDGRRLPYAENLVNLIVADGSSAVPIEEMLRVLAPRGVVLVRSGDRGQPSVGHPILERSRQCRETYPGLLRPGWIRPHPER